LRDNELEPDRNGLRSLLFGGGFAPQAAAEVTSAPSTERNGHVDFYGYHPEAGAWFFCGWVPNPWGDADKPSSIVARFEDGSLSSETTLATFYYRDDTEGRGVGFVLSLTSPDGEHNHLVSLELEFVDLIASLQTTAAGPALAPHELVEWLTPLLTGGEANSNRARLQAMLLPAKVETAGETAGQGFVDIYGYHAVAGDWLLCGWVSNEAEDLAANPVVAAHFERGEVRGEAVSVSYPRDDLGGRGLGIVLFIPGSGSPLGGLLSVAIEAGGLSFRIYPGLSIRRLREQELISALRGIVASAPAGLPRDVMLSILGRQGFTGADTVGELSDRIFLEFDEAIICEPDGIVLIGWHLAKPGVVRNISPALRSPRFRDRPRQWPEGRTRRCAVGGGAGTWVRRSPLRFHCISAARGRRCQYAVYRDRNEAWRTRLSCRARTETGRHDRDEAAAGVFRCPVPRRPARL
jgi:hypothetical protein